MKFIPVPSRRGGQLPNTFPKQLFSMLEDPNINVSGDRVSQNLMRTCGWFCSPELNTGHHFMQNELSLLQEPL